MAGYGDDAGLTAWLAAQGHTLPVGAKSNAILRQRGSDYIDSTYGLLFSGYPTLGYAQERAWDRTGATAFGTDIPVGTIPTAVVSASYAAAYAEAALNAQTPALSLSVIIAPGQSVKRASAGPVDVEFRDMGMDAVTAATPMLSAVAGMLAPYLNNANRAAAVMVA